MTAVRAALAVALLWPVVAVAQDRPVHRVDVTVGGGWFGGAALGSRDANLRANARPPQPLRLFSTDVRLAGAPAFEASAAYTLTRRWAVEGGLVMSHPEIRTSITADAEAAPALAVVERIDQYLVEGRVIVMLDELRLGPRTVPFAAAGAGYLRQLHEGQTVIEEGHSYHVGGGMKHWLLARDTGAIRAAGVRIDARLYLLVAGVTVDGGAKPHGAVSAAAFVAF